MEISSWRNFLFYLDCGASWILSDDYGISDGEFGILTVSDGEESGHTHEHDDEIEHDGGATILDS